MVSTQRAREASQQRIFRILKFLVCLRIWNRSCLASRHSCDLITGGRIDRVNKHRVTQSSSRLSAPSDQETRDSRAVFKCELGRIEIFRKSPNKFLNIKLSGL